MPSHTKAEKKKNKSKPATGDSTLSAIGRMLDKLRPGGFSKSLLDNVNEKIKGATDKKK